MGTQPEANKTVLIVEDNTIAREGMAVVLRQAGYEVVTFPEGKEALDHLNNNPSPGVILLDMMIPYPGVDGWRFLERRKRMAGADNVPVIVTTGLGIAADEWAASLGACGLVRKPIEVAELLREIRKCLPEQDKT
jgi:CheY-like chemotaxis protein